MSAFLTGAAVDCGPVNVLRNVGGRLDKDFSLQQVSPPSSEAAMRLLPYKSLPLTGFRID